MRGLPRAVHFRRLSLQLATAALLVTLVFAGLSVRAPGIALALGPVDQLHDPTNGGTPAVIATSAAKLAQTFTVGVTGQMDGVAFYYQDNNLGSTGNLTVEIRTTSGGIPTGTVLATGTILAASILPTRQSIAVILPPFAVTAGDKLALVVSAPGLSGGAMITLGANTPATYAGGERYDDPIGGGFVVNSANDLSFATFVVPPPTSTPTRTPTSAHTATPTVTATATITPTVEASATPTATSTGTAAATATPTATSTGTAVATATVPATATTTPIPFQQTDDDDDDDGKPETKLERQQREDTNRLGRDDIATEGNVVEVGQDEQGAFVMIANRDGLVMVRLNCGSSCPAIRPGDYIQVAGVKEHEHLYYADEVSISR